MIRRLIAAAALLLAPVPLAAQDSLSTSTAPAPTQIRLPLLRLVADGTRVVVQVQGSTDAVVGATNGLYLGPNGYTVNIAEAQDIRGPQGGGSSGTQIPGPMGAPGKSAYEIWLDAGNTGTESDFLSSLRGVQGIPGGPGTAGSNGIDGKSAYQLWLDAGNSGTASDFLASLVGQRGETGGVGASGRDGIDGQNGNPAQLRIQSGQIQWSNGGAWQNLLATADLVGAKGDKGDSGSNGTNGQAATIAVGSVSTGAPGSQAIVTNTGNSSAASFNFTIPAGYDGQTGPKGDVGATPNLTIGAVTTLSPGSQATAALSGTAYNPVLSLGLPAGQIGATGGAGAAGAAATLSVGTITTGAAGSSASCSNGGTSSAAILNCTIPRGNTGANGSDGAAATVSVGTVTTLAAGATPTVTNGGTSSAAVLNFGLPRSAVYLNDVTLAQTAVVAIALGPRTITVSTNCQVGDRMFMSPAAAMPAGYMLGDIFCSAAGTAQATIYAPLLAIGASYSIAVKITAFR